MINKTETDLRSMDLDKLEEAFRRITYNLGQVYLVEGWYSREAIESIHDWFQRQDEKLAAAARVPHSRD
jgi:hypothetical protein